jgi:NADPH2:quinone reductase
MSKMRAFQIDRPGGASDLKPVVVDIPAPGPGQVRVRVAYCGLNPLDVILRSGGAAWMAPGWPLTPGVEHSGVVDAVGPGVAEAWLGCAVVSVSALGGNAEYSVADIGKVARLDPGIGLLVGAAYRGCSHTAWRLLHETSRVRAGDTAVFHSAAGPVGIMLTQFARRLGLTCIGLVGGAAKRDYAAGFGADHLVDTRGETGWWEEVARLTGGKGAKLIVDGDGGEASRRNFDVVAAGGEVVFIGATSGVPSAPVVPGQLIVGHAAARGFNLPVAETLGAPAADVDAQIVALLQSGEVKAPIASVSPFEAIPDLHRRFEARQIQGRAVIEVGGEAVEGMRRRAPVAAS